MASLRFKIGDLLGIEDFILKYQIFPGFNNLVSHRGGKSNKGKKYTNCLNACDGSVVTIMAS